MDNKNETATAFPFSVSISASSLPLSIPRANTFENDFLDCVHSHDTTFVGLKIVFPSSFKKCGKERAFFYIRQTGISTRLLESTQTLNFVARLLVSVHFSSRLENICLLHEESVILDKRAALETAEINT